MIDPKNLDPLAYVTAVAPAMGFEFPPERLDELAAAFALVIRVGMPALACEVAGEIEPAPVFVA